MHLNPEQYQLTAIVLAGDRTKADSLINHTKVGSKAMIDIDGTPMVRRVLNSLRASRVVNKIALSGPEETEVAKDEQLARWVEDGEVLWKPPGISPSTSAYEAMQSLDPEESVLLTTAVVLGVVTHATPVQEGVAHISLLTLALLTVTWVSARAPSSKHS